jgi:hypothetical protein
MAKQALDARNILTGKDGELYSDDGTFLAQINTWQAQVSIENQDYQPAGTAQKKKVFTGYSVTLTFTETVVKDALLLKKLIDALRAGKQVEFGFQGVLNGQDGTQGRQVYRGCVPDGSIDLANVQPGDILNRSWSLGVNEPPELQSLLGGAL